MEVFFLFLEGVSLVLVCEISLYLGVHDLAAQLPEGALQGAHFPLPLGAEVQVQEMYLLSQLLVQLSRSPLFPLVL